MQLHALHSWNDSVSLSNKILLSYNFCLELLCLRCMVIVHLLYLLTLEMNSLSTSVICHRCLIIQLVTADMICCFTFEHFLMKPKALREFPEIRIQICVCLCICSIALQQFTKKNVCISIEALQSGSPHLFWVPSLRDRVVPIRFSGTSSDPALPSLGCLWF